MGKIGIKALGCLILLLAAILSIGVVGYFVFSQILNHPKYNADTGELTDQIGRKVSRAPWFVITFLPFLTDSVTPSLEYQIGRTLLAPAAPSKYWLGWGWSFLDWLGSFALLAAAAGCAAGGWELISR